MQTRLDNLQRTLADTIKELEEEKMRVNHAHVELDRQDERIMQSEEELEELRDEIETPSGLFGYSAVFFWLVDEGGRDFSVWGTVEAAWLSFYQQASLVSGRNLVDFRLVDCQAEKVRVLNLFSPIAEVSDAPRPYKTTVS